MVVICYNPETMTRYTALLRGINVGGHRVKMTQLGEIFRDIGFSNIKTYINSGNVFFDSVSIDKQDLTNLIEQRLQAVLGYEVPTFLRTTAELKSIISQDAFKGIKLTDDKRFSVLFTKQPIPEKVVLPQYSSKNDMEIIAVNVYEAFVVWHIINGRPPSGRFQDSIIPIENTSRFYHTLSKILAAAN